MKNSVTFLYIINNHFDNELIPTIVVLNISEKNLIKEVKNYHTANFKILKKIIEEQEARRWKDFPCLRNNRIDSLEKNSPTTKKKKSKNSIKFPSKFQCHFSQKWENYTEILMKMQKTMNSKSKSEQNE